MTDKEANDIAEAMYETDPVYESERVRWQVHRAEINSDYGARPCIQLPADNPDREKSVAECVVEVMITIGLDIIVINTLLSLFIR